MMMIKLLCTLLKVLTPPLGSFRVFTRTLVFSSIFGRIFFPLFFLVVVVVAVIQYA